MFILVSDFGSTRAKPQSCNPLRGINTGREEGVKFRSYMAERTHNNDERESTRCISDQRIFLACFQSQLGAKD